jgi:hypothetical protein
LEHLEPLDPSIRLPGSKLLFPDLPAEIRNIIYKILLERRRNSINLVSPQKKPHPQPALKTWKQSALFRVNKQIYTEASHVFYAMNTINIGHREYGSTEKNQHPRSRNIRLPSTSTHLARITKNFIQFTPQGLFWLSKEGYDAISRERRRRRYNDDRDDWASRDREAALALYDISTIAHTLVKHFRCVKELEVGIYGGYTTYGDG